MLAGRVPFEGDSSVAIAMQHVSDHPPPLRSLAPDVPESLALVVAHAMLKDPAQRYASADEFAADLDRVRRGLVPVAATAAHTAIVTHEPTELVPAVEATRIAPRAESTPLLSGGGQLPPRPTPRKRSRWPWLLVLLLLLAVGALAAFALGGVPGGDSPTTKGTTSTATTPPPVASHTLDNLEGKTISEALAVLHGYQLGLDILKPQNVRDASHVAGIVVGSNPDPGKLLRRGDSVRLKVSRGQKPIPNIVDKTQADAQQELGGDFTFVPASEASDTIDKGKVTRTDPPVGTSTPVGSRVKVYISTGPASVQVPSLVGKSEDDARTALSKAGLIVKEPPGKRCSDNVDVGQVAKQGTSPGKLVLANTAIGFDIASSPCTVDVPNVRTLPVDQAVGLLEAKTIAAGNIKIQYQTVTQDTQNGQVLDQDIEGTNTKPFVVHLTVGQLDPNLPADTTPAP
jgi:serine/threonine-protein kinase